MDIQRPIENQRISADWGRAVADAIAAGRLSGAGVLRTPSGTSLAPGRTPPPALPGPPEAPFSCVLAADGEGGVTLRVRKGDVRDALGEALGYSASGGFEAAGDWFEAQAPEGTATVAAEDDGEGGWTLRLAREDEGAAQAWRVPLAEIEVSGDARRVRQLRTGDITLQASEHWGEAEPVVEIAADGAGEWSATVSGNGATAVAESRLVDIDVDSEGRVTGRHYRTQTIDANGNVIAISDRTESSEPEPGEGAEGPKTPPCGNPLNLVDDHNPLDGDGGGSGGDGVDDYNPLDHEGPGGFTPECGGEAA